MFFLTACIHIESIECLDRMLLTVQSSTVHTIYVKIKNPSWDVVVENLIKIRQAENCVVRDGVKHEVMLQGVWRSVNDVMSFPLNGAIYAHRCFNKSNPIDMPKLWHGGFDQGVNTTSIEITCITTDDCSIITNNLNP